MSLELTISIYDPDRANISKDAKVELLSASGVKTQFVFESSFGKYSASNLEAGYYIATVSATGFLSEKRTVFIDRNLDLTFILGKKGMSFYNRGDTRVPFEPSPGVVAISTRTPEMFSHQKFAQRMSDTRVKMAVEMDETQDTSSNVVVFRIGDPSVAMERVKLDDLMEEFAIEHIGAMLEESAEGSTFLSQEIIVKFRADTPESTVQEIAEDHDLLVLRKLPYSTDAYQMRSEKMYLAYEILDICESIMTSSAVRYAEPNLIVSTTDDAIVPTDFLYPSQWHLPLIGMEEAWQILRDRNAQATQSGDPADVTFGSSNVIIGVMDRGIESQTNAGTVTAVNPDFDTAVSDGSQKVYRYFDFSAMVANNDSPPNNHGMGVAGVAAAAVGNPSVVAGEIEGGVGAAANCRVIGLIRPAGGTETQYADAYYWCAGFDPNSIQPNFPASISPGADIITNSFGAFTGSAISGTMRDCFDDLTENGRGGRGVVLFFSAGNVNATVTLRRPWATYEKTIAVAASTEGEVKAGTSNFGPEIDVCAPSSNGSRIVSCDIVGNGDLAGHTGGSLDYRSDFGGTSSATPLTAGVAALMLSVNPFLTAEDVRDILRNTAVKIDFANTDPIGQWVDNDGDGVAEFSQWYGYGRIDAEAAVQEAALYMSAQVNQLTHPA